VATLGVREVEHLREEERRRGAEIRRFGERRQHASNGAVA